MREEKPAGSTEIACDESGYEGEKLIGGTTDVFAHASVRLSVAESADCITELRRRIRSPAQEYKSGHLLREKHRDVLVWWLGEDGPIHGRARVFLVDKTFRLVTGLGDALGAAGMAGATLYREAPNTFGRDRWVAFLDSFNTMVRAKDRLTADSSTNTFLDNVSHLDLPSLNGALGEIMLPLRLDANQVVTRARMDAELHPAPRFDPLIPAILQAVSYWGGRNGAVFIIHDRQNLLTRRRVARLIDLATERGLGLAGFELVDSMADPRVQMADFLAGVARKIASLELNHAGDPELTELLRAHVEESSVWGDPRSWGLLSPY